MIVVFRFHGTSHKSEIAFTNNFDPRHTSQLVGCLTSFSKKAYKDFFSFFLTVSARNVQNGEGRGGDGGS